MKILRILTLLFLLSSALTAQKLTSEALFKEYFVKQTDSLDPIEGIWNVSTTQEFYNYDTLYDVQNFPKAAKIAVMKKDNKYESFNLTGESYDVQFSETDVKGVYLYRNFFPETNDYSKTSAVISKAGEMEYTYEFPGDYLRVKFADSYEEGTRVVNILKWTKVFPETKKK
ncbi:MAG TPA: hypothetical protein PLU53_05575 [Bacteroidia bacterium]|nr:hypothetical protein [Bacteroidia bacterium]